MDEPTAQVDFKSQRAVLKNLFDMCKANRVTVLMIAHRLETAATYCEKVLVLDKGTVIQFDRSEKILAEMSATNSQQEQQKEE